LLEVNQGRGGNVLPIKPKAVRPVLGRFVAILGGGRTDRGLRLEELHSRVVQAGEVHEVIVTDDDSAEPGSVVDNIAYLGFVEIYRGGVLYPGEQLLAKGTSLGRLAGFDLTHSPNHFNLVFVAESMHDGIQLNLQLEEEVVFQFQKLE
jgi:hypothetical protein